MLYAHKSAVVFSLRAILRHLPEGEGLPIPQTFNLHPGVRPILNRLGRNSYLRFLVLNVPELYTGLLNEDYLFTFLEQLQARLPKPARFVSIYYEGNPLSSRFMPRAGMLADLKTDHFLTDADFLFVGRDIMDYEAANSARFDFMGADKFFSTVVPKRI